MTVVAAFAAMSMNAQCYIGGTIGFNSSTDKATTPGVEETNTGFTIAPEFGMKLDDKLGWGIQVGFGTTKNKKERAATATIPATSVETTLTNIEVSPYLRYQIVQWGKANFFVDGGIDLGFTSAKDMKSAMNLGLFASPGVAYNVSDKWSLVARINKVFTLGYTKGMVPDVAGAPDAPTNFRIGAGLDDFVLGALTFGIYYNF